MNYDDDICDFCPQTVAVEGNIGCGKTTFLEYFKTLSGVEVHGHIQSLNKINC